MRKITNHKGWLSAILSIIPFFIFMVFFQAIGLGVSSALGQAGIIEFNFDSYLEAEDAMRDYLAADTIIQYFDLIGIFLLLWILMRFVDKEPFIKLGFNIKGKTNDKRIAYVSNKGDGPFGDCEWTPTIKPGEAYF